MLIDDSRPKLYCKGVECQNISPNGRVFFLEDNHVYLSEDDIVDGKIKDFKDSKYKFRSPTGIIGDLKEKFETEKQAKKYVKKHELDITWKELVAEWKAKGDKASEEGTLLHGYAESLWNDWEMEKPDLVKADYADDMYNKLSSEMRLVKTELLVYSHKLRIAGQVDLLLGNEDKSEFYLYDYKFIKKPLEKKSWYNPRTRRYKMMKGPFKKLYDSNFYHYSVQMELYRYLMGKAGKKVKRKVLLVFTPEGWDAVPGYDIKVWVSSDGLLHARYRDYKGKIYDSSLDKVYLKEPIRII